MADASSSSSPQTAKPPPLDLNGGFDEEQRLVAGYVTLKSGGKTRRLWMAVTDVSLSAEDEKGGKELWAADLMREATRADQPIKNSTPRGQYGVVVRIEPPARPEGPLTLRRQASSASAELLSLLSPLWRGRPRTLTPGRPRTPSARRLSGGFGLNSSPLGGSAKSPPKALEYTLLLPTSWEADAWAAAIGESQRAVVQAPCPPPPSPPGGEHACGAPALARSPAAR